MKNTAYNELKKIWLEKDIVPQYLKDELKKMNDKTTQERFETELKFGTGGLRGLIGAGTNAMNIFTVSKATLGLANYIIETYQDEAFKRGVSICFDNRHHSQEFAKVAAEVFAAKGIKVYLFKELRPTPMASFAVRYFNCVGGVMITASHNPKEYNGYKVYNHNGAQLDLEQSDKVIREVEKVKDLFDIPRKDDKDLIKPVLENVEKAYLNEIGSIRINKDKDEVDYSLRILYSPMHGTGTKVIPGVLEDEGFKVIPYEPHMSIDPNFSNAKVVNPEFKDAWKGLPKAADKENCDLILMSDPDADRVGVCVRRQSKQTGKDEFVLLNGNQQACVLLHYLITQKMKKGLLQPNSYVVSTVVTTDLLKVMCEKYGIKFYQTLTGFKFIAEIITNQKEDEHFLYGAEESIGSIIGSFVRDKDSAQGCLMFSEIAGWLKKQGKTIVDYLDEIYTEFGCYFEYTENITLKGKEGAEKIQKIMDYFRANNLNIPSAEFVKVDDMQKQQSFEISANNELKLLGDIKLPKSNVLKFYNKQGGWIIFRPSGTEPKIKIYFECVGSSGEHVQVLMEKLTKDVLQIIQKII